MRIRPFAKQKTRSSISLPRINNERQPNFWHCALNVMPIVFDANRAQNSAAFRIFFAMLVQVRERIARIDRILSTSWQQIVCDVAYTTE
ncbi:hypothetical protein GWI33_007454 [Rhynchophorus ferrugineus]|uniref:Uncharacterized protein n=1 Tax=Rhynchophorus ferrugineus TaxID=354439 RepID=A0A834IDH4_RHYFE|nr:hypothetical protein GWI33_007454 [Rhynchophorus ferrugineus]